MFDKINNPILFQGNLNKKKYFEGWYYKQVSKDERSVISFIPGVSLFDNEKHSFVQYIFLKLDKNNKRVIKSGYLTYSLIDFKFSRNPFIIQIGENSFSESQVNINLCDNKISIQGTLQLSSFNFIEKSILMPNIMGFFAYLPKMECNHGVISMNHKLNGILRINNEEIDFNDGKGYIEKDWGTSFPEKYLWVQCNNFKNKTTSIFSSVAKIPYMNLNFNGHVSNLMIDEKQYRFATYNNSKLKIEKITSENIKYTIENSRAKLIIEAISKSPAEIIAPQGGKMQKKIEEDISGEVKLHLYDKKSKYIYEDIGSMAGIENVNF